MLCSLIVSDHEAGVFDNRFLVDSQVAGAPFDALQALPGSAQVSLPHHGLGSGALHLAEGMVLFPTQPEGVWVLALLLAMHAQRHLVIGRSCCGRALLIGKPGDPACRQAAGGFQREPARTPD